MNANVHSLPSRFKLEAESRFPTFKESGARDYRAWAKRIMFRVERGDTSVSLIQRQFATDALAAPDA